MSARYMVFCDVDEFNSDISQNVFDYIGTHHFVPPTGPIDDLDTEFAYTFGAHAMKPVSFMASSGCECGGETDGIYLEQTRTPQPLKLFLDEQSMMDCLDQHGNFLYHHSLQTKAFGLSFVEKGALRDFKTKNVHTTLPVFNLFSGIKLGALPIYVVFMDSNRVANQTLWSTFYLRATDTRCSRVSDTSFQLKRELFDTVILTNGCQRFGKNLVRVPGDRFEFEIFGLDTPERCIHSFKNERLPDFNEHLEVDANVPWSFTGRGVVSADLSALAPGALAYLHVHVKAGSFFEKWLPPGLSLDTDFMLTK